jgi:hypothetical protein
MPTRSDQLGHRERGNFHEMHPQQNARDDCCWRRRKKRGGSRTSRFGILSFPCLTRLRTCSGGPVQQNPLLSGLGRCTEDTLVHLCPLYTSVRKVCCAEKISKNLFQKQQSSENGTPGKCDAIFLPSSRATLFSIDPFLSKSTLHLWLLCCLSAFFGSEAAV